MPILLNILLKPSWAFWPKVAPIIATLNMLAGVGFLNKALSKSPSVKATLTFFISLISCWTVSLCFICPSLPGVEGSQRSFFIIQSETDVAPSVVEPVLLIGSNMTFWNPTGLNAEVPPAETTDWSNNAFLSPVIASALENGFSGSLGLIIPPSFISGRCFLEEITALFIIVT